MIIDINKDYLMKDRSPILIWDNLLLQGNISASNSAVGSFAQNIAGPQTFDYYTPAQLPADLTLTLPFMRMFNVIAIAAHNMASKNTYFECFLSFDAISFQRHFGTYFPSDDPVIIVLPDADVRAIRFTFTGAQVPSVGAMMIGERVHIPSMVSAPYVPMAHARRVDLLAGNSLGGQMFDARVRRYGGSARIGFNPVPRDWAYNVLPAFAAAYDAGQPFFFASSPVLNPTDVAYARRAQGAGELRPEWRAGGRFVDMALEVETYGA